MSSQEIYRKFAQYYDAYVGSFDADLRLYKSLCCSAQNILEIGCGTGRVLRPMLESGLHVTGIDISNEMLNVARSRLSKYLENGTLRLMNHDFRESPLSEKYDCALVTFYTFNYLLTESDQHSFLLNVQKVLTSTGILVMDLFYPQSLVQSDISGCWKESLFDREGASVVLKQKRQMFGPIEKRTQIYTEGSHREEIITERRYVSKQDVEVLLKNAGFTDIRMTDEYDEAGLHSLTDGETTDSAFICVATGAV